MPSPLWTPAALAALVLLVVTGCTEEVESLPGGPTPAGPSASAAPSDGPLDPCTLLTPEEVAAHSDVEPDEPRYRGLSPKEEHVVECRLDGASSDAFTIGYVGYEPGNVRDLVPGINRRVDRGGAAWIRPREPLRGVGDEAYLALDSGMYHAAARKGEMQVLLTRVVGQGEPDPREDVIALLEAAVTDLPASVPMGTTVLPPECPEADAGVITDLVGSVVLARGSAGGSAMVCDYLGETGIRVLADAEPASQESIDESVQTYRDADDYYVELSGFPGAVVFLQESLPAYSAYVDGGHSLGMLLEPEAGDEPESLREAGDALLGDLAERVRNLEE